MCKRLLFNVSEVKKLGSSAQRSWCAIKMRLDTAATGLLIVRLISHVQLSRQRHPLAEFITLDGSKFCHMCAEELCVGVLAETSVTNRHLFPSLCSPRTDTRWIQSHVLLPFRKISPSSQRVTLPTLQRSNVSQIVIERACLSNTFLRSGLKT